MRTARFLFAVGFAFATSALLTACSGGGGSVQSVPQASQQTASDRATAASANGDTNVDWPSYNNDPKSQRFSTLTQITASSARNLHEICRYNVAQVNKPSGFNFETGPIVVQGVMYFSTIDDTYAVDASNCKLLWDTNRPALGGGLANRGVAYANGTIFRGTVDGNVVAMNAKTGKILWDRHVANAPETITAAPITWRQIVFIGTSGAETGAQCHVYAIDQNSGAVLWSFQTVPNDGPPTIAAWTDTTGSATTTHPAGGSTWSSYTLDPSKGVLYVPTGNPGPDFDDRERGGANTYTDSVVALNAFTGQLLAAYALTPHDVHDWDLAAAPVLADGGQNTRIVAGSKDGYVYSVDPGSGNIGWHTPITTVDAAPQIPSPGNGINFCPGTTGGVEWNGPAYSQALNAVFSNGVDICAMQLVEESNFIPYSEGAAQCFGLWLGVQPCFSFGTPSSNKSGWVSALDASSGAVRWKYHSPTPMIAGVTVTASGLLFTGDLNGNVLVLDAASGSTVKSISTGEPIGGGVISYAINGKQYVAVAAGIASKILWTPAQPNGPSSIVVLGL